MRILIIDDYRPLGYILSAMCQKIGNQVDVVFTLAEAMDKLDEIPPCDVIFLDLTLLDSGPNATIEAIKRLRAKAKKLVIMTGNSREDFVVRAMNEGADDYVFKNDTNFTSVVQSYMEDIDFRRPLVSTRGD